MACSACAKRRQQQANKVRTPAPTRQSPSSAQSQGSNLRDKLRFTGR